ncbi:D-beta-hydroxybutyrate dehydrogenase, mitochondrial-like [Anopheles cruzii]|uniref:D-beta-hydroxybutyrate dehydrogenase, mitochondrial-like n=1 Tax=Anopheles cruzii TaxID=68878 RepID=UPI0022EC63F4|nr:D-beta-hydroxybutyrate dehydrogenase, mitochondrial-like [Anopheles cruzii]
MGGRLIPLALNLIDKLSIYKTQDAVQNLFETELRGCQLYAIVNNSAVMCFGEAEWQTTTLISEQVSVNLNGPLMFTLSLLDILRKDRGRLVFVTSHCGQQPLPGLSVYSATKAGLHAWCTAVRLELAPHRTPVVELVPGSFLLHSNICARQAHFFDDMWSNMKPGQQLFYETYFGRFRDYLLPLCRRRPIEPFPADDPLLESIHGALFDKHPKAIYKCESWRYWAYYTAFAFTPRFVRDKLIRRFLAMPEYNGENHAPVHGGDPPLVEPDRLAHPADPADDPHAGNAIRRANDNNLHNQTADQQGCGTKAWTFVGDHSYPTKLPPGY